MRCDIRWKDFRSDVTPVSGYPQVMTDPAETIDPTELMTDPARVPNVRAGAVSGLAGVPLDPAPGEVVYPTIEYTLDPDGPVVLLGELIDVVAGLVEGWVDLGPEAAIGVEVPAGDWPDWLDWVRTASDTRQAAERANAIWQHEIATESDSPKVLVALYIAVSQAIPTEDDPVLVTDPDTVPGDLVDVDGLLGWVNAAQDIPTLMARAKSVLDAEMAQEKPRVTLTRPLDKVLNP